MNPFGLEQAAILYGLLLYKLHTKNINLHPQKKFNKKISK